MTHCFASLLGQQQTPAHTRQVSSNFDAFQLFQNHSTLCRFSRLMFKAASCCAFAQKYDAARKRRWRDQFFFEELA